MSPLLASSSAPPRPALDEKFFSPECRCGSRQTKPIGESSLLRQCQRCGETYLFRIQHGKLKPFSPLTALLLDLNRAKA